MCSVVSTCTALPNKHKIHIIPDNHSFVRTTHIIYLNFSSSWPDSRARLCSGPNTLPSTALGRRHMEADLSRKHCNFITFKFQVTHKYEILHFTVYIGYSACRQRPRHMPAQVFQWSCVFVRLPELPVSRARSSRRLANNADFEYTAV